MDEFKLLEIIMSAKINFENFVKMVPAAAPHPLFQIAKEQLDEAASMVEAACDAH